MESLPLNSDDVHDISRHDDDPFKVPDLNWKNVYAFDDSVLRKDLHWNQSALIVARMIISPIIVLLKGRKC